MRRSYHALTVTLVLLILCLPLAAVSTIVLLPVWSWLEARFHIEAVGHSGPAGWCYAMVYVGWAGLLGSGLLWRRRRARSSGSSGAPEA